MVNAVIDLRPQFGPTRDQGHRPTCLAFAASDTHAGLRLGWAELSCEYAFYRAQKRAGRSASRGALLQQMLDAIRLDGQPEEQQWPYAGANPDETKWAPPSGVGPLYKRNGAAHHEDFSWLIGTLDQKIPAIVLMMLSRSFFLPQAGAIIDESPGEKPEPAQRHAVVAVGHGLVDHQKAILVRNSWGTDWGENGYGWLTERYLTPRMFALALLVEN